MTKAVPLAPDPNLTQYRVVLTLDGFKLWEPLSGRTGGHSTELQYER